MHHFSMEFLSTFWLCTYPYLNTDSPIIHGFPTFTLQSSLNSLHHTAIDQDVQSRWPQVHIWGSLWHWDGSPLQAQLYPQVETVLYNHSSLLDWPFNMSSAHMALPVVLQLRPMVPTVVSQPTLNDIPLLSHSFWPTISSTIMTQRPYHLEEDITVVGGEYACQGRGKDWDHYWITARWLHRSQFSTQVTEV